MCFELSKVVSNVVSARKAGTITGRQMEAAGGELADHMAKLVPEGQTWAVQVNGQWYQQRYGGLIRGRSQLSAYRLDDITVIIHTNKADAFEYGLFFDAYPAVAKAYARKFRAAARDMTSPQERDRRRQLLNIAGTLASEARTFEQLVAGPRRGAGVQR